MTQMAPDSSISNKVTSQMDMVTAYLDNKTLVVEFAFTTIQQALKAVLKQFEQNIKDSADSSAAPQIRNLLTDKTYLKLDLFMDSDKQIRKTNYDLQIPLQGSNGKDGVTMVPARYVAEQFGAEVQWKEELQLLTLIDGATGNPIVLTIGSPTAHVNGAEVSLESPAIIRNGSTYVPLRFITEALGAKLDWNESTNTATIIHE
jgi:hypothetical protein